MIHHGKRKITVFSSKSFRFNNFNSIQIILKYFFCFVKMGKKVQFYRKLKKSRTKPLKWYLLEIPNFFSIVIDNHPKLIELTGCQVSNISVWFRSRASSDTFSKRDALNVIVDEKEFFKNFPVLVIFLCAIHVIINDLLSKFYK